MWVGFCYVKLTMYYVLVKWQNSKWRAVVCICVCVCVCVCLCTFLACRHCSYYLISLPLPLYHSTTTPSPLSLLLAPLSPVKVRTLFWLYLVVMVAVLVAYVFEIICWLILGCVVNPNK